MMHSQYKSAANEALAHVKSQVKYRGLNTGGGWIRNPLDVPQKFYARIKSAVIGNQRSDDYKGKFDAEVYIPELTRLGIESGTGNCSELSAIAFMYLVKKQIGPLEYFGVWRGNWNHAFVILNRPDKPVKNFSDWSYSAVVIDPLYDRVADAGFLATWYPRMFPLQQKDLIVRLES
jgi:hypothetical protein